MDRMDWTGLDCQDWTGSDGLVGGQGGWESRALKHTKQPTAVPHRTLAWDWMGREKEREIGKYIHTYKPDMFVCCCLSFFHRPIMIRDSEKWSFKKSFMNGTLFPYACFFFGWTLLCVYKSFV